MFSKLFSAVTDVYQAVERAEGYSLFESIIRERIAAAKGPLFLTNAGAPTYGNGGKASLFDAFLSLLRSDRRQHYNCNCCRKFVNGSEKQGLAAYGSLATVAEDGTLRSLLWDPLGVPAFFAASVAQLDQIVRTSTITGVFYSSEDVWGKPISKTANVARKTSEGYFTHLSGRSWLVYSNPLKTAAQAMAEKKEEYGILQRSLAEYPLKVAKEAVRVLESDSLYRSEAALGIAKWFLELHEGVKGLTYGRGKELRDNKVWLAVATAPPGFSHVKTTMIGTLMDDIAAGRSFEFVSRRWNQKMDPTRYQRPQAPPSEGTIRQAEEIVRKLEAANALKRRFATLADVGEKIWVPRPEVGLKETKGYRGGEDREANVFGHLLPKTKQEAPSLTLPSKKMTWEKFSREVLPRVLSMEMDVPSGPCSFYSLVTAVDPTAPPILQWDGFEHTSKETGKTYLYRNPVSWYFYNRGATAAEYNVKTGWLPVRCVFREPPAWYRGLGAAEKFGHHPTMVYFVLPGAKDLKRLEKGNKGGLFFPSYLRSEYHAIRSVMEAYSENEEISGGDEGDANGIAFQASSEREVSLRVITPTGVESYRIDRWE